MHKQQDAGNSKFRIRGKKSEWRVGGVTRFRELRVKMEGSPEGPLQPLRSTNSLRVSLHRVRKTIFFANLCGKTKCWNCALNNFLKKKNLKQSLSDLFIYFI